MRLSLNNCYRLHVLAYIKKEVGLSILTHIRVQNDFLFMAASLEWFYKLLRVGGERVQWFIAYSHGQRIGRIAD